MGGIRTTVLLRGVDAVMARLEHVAAAADDISPVFPLLGDLFAARQDTVFDTNGLGRWAPTSARVIREHQGPLVDFGVMREGLTKDAPRSSGKYTRFVAFGPPHRDRRVMNPAVLHTYGYRDRGGGRVPARPPVPRLRAAERSAWVGVVRAHMRKAAR